MTPIELYKKAHSFAREKHRGQVDDDGRDYYNAHLKQVAGILNAVTTDLEVVCAGLLHDTIEDCGVTIEELGREFGKRVADLVSAVSHEGVKDEVGYYFPRLLPAENMEAAFLIKFADRMSNISRMSSWSRERKLHYLKRSVFWKTEGKA